MENPLALNFQVFEIEAQSLVNNLYHYVTVVQNL